MVRATLAALTPTNSKRRLSTGTKSRKILSENISSKKGFPGYGK
jgi:hypothetical protein